MIQPLTAEDAQRFSDVCRAAQYTEPALADKLGTVVPPPPHHPQFQLFLQQTEERTPFNFLTRLFFLGTSVLLEEAGAVLPTWLLTTCVECGVVVADNDVFQPTVLIIPCGVFLVTADLHLPQAALNDDYVLTVNQPALHLLNFTIRQPVSATLDLCSGSALHGMAASRFSQRVVASDLSPRAEVFGRFNAALNGCHNLEFLSGHLFSTVVDEKFDLILCNPPFVISPTVDATYRDNPLELDSFVRDLLHQAPQHLEEGGYFQMICEWVEVKGQDWQNRLQMWLQDSGCDAWILQANRQLPDTYACGRLRETTADRDELEKRRSQWLRHFQHHEVEAIHGGLIFLRRRRGANWFDVGQITSNVQHLVGDAILQGFRNRDLLYASGGDELILSSQLRVAPGLCLEEKSHWEEDAWQSDSLVLRIEKDLPVSIGIDANVRGLLERFDGRTSVADVADEFARKLGFPVDDVRDKCLEIVRMLIENGCLLSN